jgi:short-subunit dehydrogenase
MERRFEGKKVVIIGASGGLGKSYARAFINEGASVLLCGRNQEKLQKIAQSLAGEASVAQVDLTKAESIENLASHASNWSKTIDIVVNATGFDVRKSLDDHQLEEINRSVNLNLVGAILISKAFLPYMRENKDSTIVHMGGFADGRLAFPYYSVDVATRSGIYSFVESMNRELRQEGSEARLTYFCPNSADTAAERPYHSVWREMGVAISPTEQVAAELLKAIERKQNTYLMGGIAVRFFAKLNGLFPKVADIVMLNKYSRILKKYFGSTNSEIITETQKKKHKFQKIALSMIITSFLLYVFLLAVPFLPISVPFKVILTSLMVGSSEVLFWSGGLLYGKELLTKKIKKLPFCNCFSRS